MYVHPVKKAKRSGFSLLSDGDAMNKRDVVVAVVV
jgi:hypothetical protein